MPHRRSDCSLFAAPAPASQLVGSTPGRHAARRRAATRCGLHEEQRRQRTVLVDGRTERPAAVAARPQVEFAATTPAAARRVARRRRVRVPRAAAGPTTVPALAMLVAACKAPDGSYWALPALAARSSRCAASRRSDRARSGRSCTSSHWTGPLPELEVSPNWTYGGRWQGLFGRLSYQRRARPRRSDALGAQRRPVRPLRLHRHLQLDLRARLEARHRRRRRTSANGAFCFSFVAAGAAARLPAPGAARARERRAAPRDGHGPGRDARSCSGRARASVLRRGRRPRVRHALRPPRRPGRQRLPPRER